jgi:hypothetical protein
MPTNVSRRLGAVARHLESAPLPVPAMAAAASPDAPPSTAPTLDSAQTQHLREFISRGVTVVGPEEHGLPPEIHRQVWENLKAGKGGDGIGARMPEMVAVLNSPGMVRALNAIMGEDWAIVPFIHSGFGGSGPNDQTWCVRATACAPARVSEKLAGCLCMADALCRGCVTDTVAVTAPSACGGYACGCVGVAATAVARL